MRVLLIEDEQHKANDLRARILRSGVSEEELKLVSSVREAVLLVESCNYDLIVLDIALPTFTGSPDSGSGGIAQAVGGIEVLRALQLGNASTKLIIVTQYPEIFIAGRQVKISHASKLISEKYGQQIIGVVLYSYKSSVWETAFDTYMEKLR